MRVILDTNILLSALISPEGVASKIVDGWLDDRFVLLAHTIQLDQLRAATRRPRIRSRLRPALAGRLINQLRGNAESIGQLPPIRRSEDPGDDFLLAMCEIGHADYLVTGDKAGLLTLKTHGRTAIVTARAFLDVIMGH